MEGNYAYIVNTLFPTLSIPDDLQIIDISNPANPQLIGSHSTSSYATDVTVKGNYAYVGLGFGGYFMSPPRGGLEIIDISDPANPQYITTYDNQSPTREVKVVGNYGYLTNGGGIEIIDLSDLTNPTLIESYETAGNAEGISVAGEYIYIADSNNNLKILSHDITNRINDTSFIDTNSLNSPIYRFQNANIPGTYLYAGEEESNSIKCNYPNFTEEGFAFYVGIEPGDDLIAMYRFQNSNIAGTYLYAGEEESVNIRENYPNFIEEGLAFYVYGAMTDKGQDIYRFQNTQLPGTYLFVGEEERRNILQNYPGFTEEGVAFKVAF